MSLAGEHDTFGYRQPRVNKQAKKTHLTVLEAASSVPKPQQGTAT